MSGAESAWRALTVLSVAAAVAVCPLTRLRRRLSPGLLLPLVVGCLAVAGTVAALHPPARGITGFALVFGAAWLTSLQGFDAQRDQAARAERGLPPLLEGDAVTRSRFDPVWLYRYRRRMRATPLPEHRPEPPVRPEQPRRTP
ncbi:hypothetical protein [Kitasatospora sp. NPDC004272]